MLLRVLRAGTLGLKVFMKCDLTLWVPIEQLNWVGHCDMAALVISVYIVSEM